MSSSRIVRSAVENLDKLRSEVKPFSLLLVLLVPCDCVEDVDEVDATGIIGSSVEWPCVDTFGRSGAVIECYRKSCVINRGDQKKVK